jgi:hypothetical protein
MIIGSPVPVVPVVLVIAGNRPAAVLIDTG